MQVRSLVNIRLQCLRLDVTAVFYLCVCFFIVEVISTYNKNAARKK